MIESLDDGLERRIVRQLDGELSASEQEGLARELLRDPEARRRMDEYAEADRQAGEALRAAFTHVGPARSPWWSARCRRLPGAGSKWLARAAAVLLAAAAGWVSYALMPGQTDMPMSSQVAGRPRVAAATHPASLEPPAGLERLLWQVWQPPQEPQAGADAAGDVFVPLPKIQGPRRTQRAVDRQIFSVYDETDDTVYLLGVDRVRRTVHAVGKDL